MVLELDARRQGSKGSSRKVGELTFFERFELEVSAITRGSAVKKFFISSPVAFCLQRHLTTGAPELWNISLLPFTGACLFWFAWTNQSYAKIRPTKPLRSNSGTGVASVICLPEARLAGRCAIKNGQRPGFDSYFKSN